MFWNSRSHLRTCEGVNGLELAYPSDTWVNQVFLGVALIAAVALSVERKRSVIRRIDGPGRDTRQRPHLIPKLVSSECEIG